MAWIDAARRDHAHAGRRYASDLTDPEWALIGLFLLERQRCGRPPTTDLRSVVEAILYPASTGCQWRMLPKEFTPASTVQRYFYAWLREPRRAAEPCVLRLRETLSSCLQLHRMSAE